MIAIILIFVSSIYISNAKDFGINIGVSIQPTFIDNDFALISGGKLGINYKNNYYLGLAISSNTLFKHKINAYDIYIKSIPIFEINHYGLDLEYYFFPEDAIHLSLGVFAGNSNIYFSIVNDEADYKYDYFPNYLNGKNTLILQPSANINLNFKDFYRIVIGISYKFYPNFEYEIPELINKDNEAIYKISSNDINGFSLNLIVRFGSF